MKNITMNKVIAGIFRFITVAAAIVAISSPSIYENSGRFGLFIIVFLASGIVAFLNFKAAEYFDPTDLSEYYENDYVESEDY